MSWLPGTATADPVTLPLEPDWLPYSFVEQNFLPPFYMDHGGWLNGGLLHDVDGDGLLESIDARNPGISCQTIYRDHASESLWWYNVPPEFAHREPCADISGVWDVTGSGRLEVVLTLSSKDGTRWAVERLDARTGELIQHLDLPLLKETRVDGEMDTDMFVVGVMDAHMPSGPRRVLILHTRTGHDLQPRGPMALDIETGEVIWQYFTGPKSLLRQAFLLDLENDGTQEIVFSGGVTNNIHEGSYEGLRDDRAHIFCLESDGRLRWRRSMPTTTIHVFLDTLREAGTDTASLVFSTRDLSSTPSQLGVMDARGNIIVTTPLPAGAKTTLVRPLADGSFAFFTALMKGGLGRWDYHRGQIQERAFVEVIGGNIHLGMVEDFLPEKGHELVVSSPGNIWVLDQGLRVLAYLNKPESLCYFNGCDRIPFPDGSSIITSRRYSQWPNINFSLTPNPRPFPVLPVTGAGLLGVGGVAMIWHRRRNRRSAATVRELRLQLMTRLQLASHGKIGALSALRRLLWTHQTCEQGFEPEDGAARVYANWGKECLETSLPSLQTALDLAELGELDSEIVQRARGSLKALRHTLDQLETAGFADATIRLHAARLEELAARTEADFMELRRSVEHLFQADPGRILLRSLEANHTIIDDHGVEVDLPEGTAPLFRMDEQELAFILDNLVENALRAMAGSPTRKLGIAWERVDDQICLLISDTGCGIIPEDWERIFTAGHSTRKGGGLGLTGSREVLTKYGGSLTVRSSEAGQGTTMMLLCPAAGNGTTIH